MLRCALPLSAVALAAWPPQKRCSLGARRSMFSRNKSQLGGELATREIGNTFVEYYYHHCFSSDHHLLASAERLGVTDKLTWVDSTMGFYWEGQLLPFNGPVDVLRFKPLNPLQRFRLGLSVLYLQKRKRWQPFQDISAADWMRRFCGDRVFDTIWGGLLKAKFGEDWHRVSMAWALGAHPRTGVFTFQRAWPRSNWAISTTLFGPWWTHLGAASKS